MSESVHSRPRRPNITKDKKGRDEKWGSSLTTEFFSVQSVAPVFFIAIIRETNEKSKPLIMTTWLPPFSLHIQLIQKTQFWFTSIFRLPFTVICWSFPFVFSKKSKQKAKGILSRVSGLNYPWHFGSRHAILTEFIFKRGSMPLTLNVRVVTD